MKDALQATPLQYPASISDNKVGETLSSRTRYPSGEICAQVVGDREIILGNDRDTVL